MRIRRWALRDYGPDGQVGTELLYVFHFSAASTLKWHQALCRPTPGFELRLERR